MRLSKFNSSSVFGGLRHGQDGRASWLSALLCAAFLAGGVGHAASVALQGDAASATQPDAPAGRMLSPVDPGGVAAAKWRERLTANDMDAREVAYTELLLAARRDTSLAMALEVWSLDSSAPELAWTARLALRELERGANAPQVLRLRWIARGQVAPLSPDSLSIMRMQQQSRTGQLEHEAPLLADHPLREAVVPQEAPFGEGSALSLLAPRGFELPNSAPVRPLQRRILHTYKLEVQPEGVSLTITESSASGQTQKVYASQDLAALVSEYPALRDEVPGLSGLARQSIGNGIYYQWKAQAEEQGADGRVVPQTTAQPFALPGAVAIVSTKILGVKCTPVSSEAGDPGLLGPGVGLRIEGRKPGTIAAELGLRRGDILVELNGEQLCNVEEISAGLLRSQGGDVVLKILDRTGLERTLTWVPANVEERQVRIEVDVESAEED